jgi:hypothetical protein
VGWVLSSENRTNRTPTLSVLWEGNIGERRYIASRASSPA